MSAIHARGPTQPARPPPAPRPQPPPDRAATRCRTPPPADPPGGQRPRRDADPAAELRGRPANTGLGKNVLIACASP
jgi:hypothetical protein